MLRAGENRRLKIIFPKYEQTFLHFAGVRLRRLRSGAAGRGFRAELSEQPAPLAPKAYVELPLGAVRAKGWLGEMLERQRSGATGRMDELYPEVMGPRNGWLGGDGDQWERGPYWIDGLLPLAWLLDDAELKAKVRPWIEWILQSQREDGYFGRRRTIRANSASSGTIRPTGGRGWWC